METDWFRSEVASSTPGDRASEPRCGRPLGMRLTKDGYLIVMDAYLGIFKVNVVTGMWPVAPRKFCLVHSQKVTAHVASLLCPHRKRADFWDSFFLTWLAGDHELLLPSSVKINGAEPKLLNDLDIATDGTIYFSDSSTRWQRRELIYTSLEGRGSGR